jgi:GMP synthase (glutamine-hydrolysing)
MNGNDFMKVSEIPLEQLRPQAFIDQKVSDISLLVGSPDYAVNALSGGVDSSTVTMLGYRALGNRLKTYFIDNGLMREGEPTCVVSLFRELGVPVVLVDASDRFFKRLEGLTDPEAKRNAITEAFYSDVFGPLVSESGARYLLQGTNFTDVKETVQGIKRQHNVLEQLGIDTEQRYGYYVIEPLVQLRKPAVRAVAKALGLPPEIYNRPPFPGPALATRIIGEVTRERVAIVRSATKIVEEELARVDAFQYLAILYNDRVTGIVDGKRAFGHHIEVRCWDSEDAVTASPTNLNYYRLCKLSRRIIGEVPGVVSVSYNITSKPPSTIEAI